MDGWMNVVYYFCPRVFVISSTKIKFRSHQRLVVFCKHLKTSCSSFTDTSSKHHSASFIVLFHLLFQHAHVKNQARLTKVTNTAAKNTGVPTPHLTELTIVQSQWNNRTPIHWTSSPTALRAQVQFSEVQEASIWKKPDSLSHYIPQQQTLLSVIRTVLCVRVDG